MKRENIIEYINIGLQWAERAERCKSKKAGCRRRAEEARSAVSSDEEDNIKVKEIIRPAG